MSNSVIKKIVASTIEQDLSSNTNIYLDSSVLGIAVFATEDGSVRVEARIQDGSFRVAVSRAYGSALQRNCFKYHPTHRCYFSGWRTEPQFSC